jgi:hypothetical protein
VYDRLRYDILTGKLQPEIKLRWSLRVITEGIPMKVRFIQYVGAEKYR